MAEFEGWLGVVDKKTKEPSGSERCKIRIDIAKILHTSNREITKETGAITTAEWGALAPEMR